MKKNSKFQPTISHLSPAWGTVNLPGSDISGNSGDSGNSGSSNSSGGSGNSGKFWSGLSWDNALSTISGLFSFGGSYFDSKSEQYKSQAELARLAAEKAEKEEDRTNYTPWIVGGVGLVVLVLVIILVARKK